MVITQDLTKLVAFNALGWNNMWDPYWVLDFAGCQIYRRFALGRGEWMCFIWINVYLDICLRLLFLQDCSV